MTTTELENRLTNNLKNYLKQKNHYGSGKLFKSIKFTVTDNGNFDIKLVAEEYIQYLDNGKFLDSFFQLNSTTELFEEYFSKKVEEMINTNL